MRQIVLIGYPKSGTTWLTRLVADIADCPVRGFWNAKPAHREMAVEGLDRPGALACYKAHQPVEEFAGRMGDPALGLAYMVRDPRDVAVSGAHYFAFGRAPRALAVLRRLPGGLALYRRLFEPLPWRLARMVDAVLEGRRRPTHWLAVPWHEHVAGYLDAGVFHVRYEDLLAAPEAEALRVARHLSLEAGGARIAEAVRRQAFDARRDGFARAGDRRQLEFLREGRAGQWPGVLTPAQLERFDRQAGGLLARLGYAPASVGSRSGSAATQRPSGS